jgi:tetratricopeptide (TPR) repeat protein
MSYKAALLAWAAKLCGLGRAKKQQAAWQAMSAAATQAEAAGDWPRAAELLAHLQATCPEASQGLRLAHCYLRAEQWQQAAACYAQADLSTASAADRYQAGFALAKLGDLTACLRHWQQLACTQPEFLAQQEQVGSLLIE